MWITPPPTYTPLWHGVHPPHLRGIPPPSRHNVRKGGIIPSIARKKFSGKMTPLSKFILIFLKKILGKKIIKYTFKSGVTVKGIIQRGEVRPMEFNTEIACESYSYKLFMEGIDTVIIKSFTNPKKYYLQIL